MIHTGEFTIKLDLVKDEKVINFFKKINVYKTEATRCVCKTKGSDNFKIVILHLYVDFIELLGRPNISPNDSSLIIGKVKDIVDDILDCKEYDLILSRIDFRYDVKVENKDERELLIFLLNKGAEKVAYMKKVKKYSNSMRYYCNSKSENVYDKEKERLAKGIPLKYYEKNILRFEAQIKSEHIRYKKRKYNIEKVFEEYFTYEVYKDYMGKMIIKTVGKGDFYSLVEAKKIINKSKLKKKNKVLLYEFIESTTKKSGLAKAKELFSRYRYDKNINMLEELGINPIIIPEKNGVRKFGFKHIENPLKSLVEEFDR